MPSSLSWVSLIIIPVKFKIDASSVKVPLSEITLSAFFCNLTYSVNAKGLEIIILLSSLKSLKLSSFIFVLGCVENIIGLL